MMPTWSAMATTMTEAENEYCTKRSHAKTLDTAAARASPSQLSSPMTRA
jgi:hypothetical protein